MWPGAAAFNPVSAADDAPIKVLLVNAHSDDESESAAVVYRITHESAGIVDQVVVTNGEGRYRYAAPSCRLPLTNAADRREELIRASHVRGIRQSYFLGQIGTGVTLNPGDAFDAWDIGRIKQELRSLLQFGKYDLVLLLLPTADTHGHHQAVAALTLEAVAELEPEDRPAALGVRAVAFAAGETCGFSECGQRTHEHFWLFEASGEAGAVHWRDFVQTMGRDSRSLDSARNVA
jgi:LmbE family N-acetylglucosaminyl deacetylase